MLYRFEDAELDGAAFELRVRGDRVPLEPQVFEVLQYLVRNHDRLVPRTEILDTVWGDRFVSDSALSSRVAAARAAIGDDGKSQRLIRTVHGRGLQFVGDVTVSDAPGAPDLVDDTDDLHQAIRFSAAPDGVGLAMATVGEGKPLVKAANWLTHVEDDWRSPVWRHWLTELGSRYRFIRYDARGCGLSDRDLRGSRLDQISTWTADLETVIAAAAVDRFALLGMSQGAVPAMDYAVRHPDRVSHLILYGAYSRGMKRRDEATATQADLQLEMMRHGWGGTNPAFRSFFTSTFLPEATSEQMRWYNELQLRTATPENAVLLETAFYDLDLSDLAQQVSVPTLVMHCRDDMATPYDEGRRLAALIPGAEFVTLDSPNHILTADEPAWGACLHELDHFISR